MRRFAIALSPVLALVSPVACGGAGDVPVTLPGPTTSPAAPGAEEDAAAAPIEQPAATPVEATPAVPAPPSAAAPFAGKGPATPILGSERGAQGTTEFPHWAHQQAAIGCAACHHSGSGGKSCGRGADCHQAAEINAPSAKDAFHGACRPCHKKKGLSTGCDFCHAPKAAPTSL